MGDYLRTKQCALQILHCTDIGLGGPFPYSNAQAGASEGCARVRSHLALRDQIVDQFRTWDDDIEGLARVNTAFQYGNNSEVRDDPVSGSFLELPAKFAHGPPYPGATD